VFLPGCHPVTDGRELTGYACVTYVCVSHRLVQNNAGQLKRLDLSHTQMSDRGVGLLVSGLKSYPTVTVLILRSNNIGARGVTELAKLLKSQGTSGLLRGDADVGIQEVRGSVNRSKAKHER